MKINNKVQLKDILLKEKKLYLDKMGRYQKYLKILKAHPDYYTWRYVRRMRITSYYYTHRKRNFIYAYMYILNCNIMNRLGKKIGIESGENVFDSGLRIFHSNGIVINGNARVGKNCTLYGDNCIGNNGIDKGCPNIGDNVRLCVGAKVLGNITLANNITVAAGAVVVKSCFRSNVILGGVPAKIISYDNEDKNYLN